MNRITRKFIDNCRYFMKGKFTPHIFIAILLLHIGLFSSYPANSAHVVKDATGICYRRLVWTDRNGLLQNYFEFVLVSQSSNLEQDIRRLKRLQLSPARSPDLTPFIWRSVWITDNQIDTLHGPDCSNLPKAYRKDEKAVR